MTHVIIEEAIRANKGFFLLAEEFNQLRLMGTTVSVSSLGWLILARINKVQKRVVLTHSINRVAIGITFIEGTLNSSLFAQLLSACLT